MTQPDIIDWDGFPEPQTTPIQDLTEAVRDLAAAIRGSDTTSPGAVDRFAGVEGRLQRYNELRNREEAMLGPEFPDFDPGAGGSLDDLPDGAYVDLDPPRVLPEEVGQKIDIFEDLRVSRVVRGVYYGDPEEGLWHGWSQGEDPELNDPWVLGDEQVEALGLTFGDFTLPTD